MVRNNQLLASKNVCLYLGRGQASWSFQMHIRSSKGGIKGFRYLEDFDYLGKLLKAVTLLITSTSRPEQAATAFDISSHDNCSLQA